MFAKTDAETVSTRVFEAFQDYLNLYWQMLTDAQALQDPEDIQRIVKAQKTMTNIVQTEIQHLVCLAVTLVMNGRSVFFMSSYLKMPFL